MIFSVCKSTKDAQILVVVSPRIQKPLELIKLPPLRYMTFILQTKHVTFPVCIKDLPLKKFALSFEDGGV